ncbi:MAG: monofunctional biosynthetic peptidoglycan transglycosylase [Bryobacteraceae bacterium]
MSWGRRLTLAIAAVVLCFYGGAIFSFVLLRWIDPPTTSVQVERRLESWFQHAPYQKRCSFVPLYRISPAFQHAVISAEDARFYNHHGFDWKQVQLAAAEDAEGKRLRGASTIDQQLVKNLFLTTSRSFVRKIIEASLVPLAEVILGKRRILELYLNVVEWGPGVYGAEAAASYWYHLPASRIGREEGARLAAILPAPRRRRPANMGAYAAIIVDRMRQAGW